MVRDFVVGGKKGKSYLASVSITVYHFVSVGNLYLQYQHTLSHDTLSHDTLDHDAWEKPKYQQCL